MKIRIIEIRSVDMKVILSKQAVMQYYGQVSNLHVQGKFQLTLTVKKCLLKNNNSSVRLRADVQRSFQPKQSWSDL